MSEVSEAIQRGLRVASQIEDHRTVLQAALRGLYRLGGRTGMEAALAGAALLVIYEKEPPPKRGEVERSPG